MYTLDFYVNSFSLIDKCFFQFVKLHIDRIVAIAPVREPSETPIKVVKEKYESKKFVESVDCYTVKKMKELKKFFYCIMHFLHAELYTTKCLY